MSLENYDFTGTIKGNEKQVNAACRDLEEIVSQAQRGVTEFHFGAILSNILSSMEIKWAVSHLVFDEVEKPEDGIFTVRIPGLENTGHGELLDIIDTALRDRSKKWEKVQVSFEKSEDEK